MKVNGTAVKLFNEKALILTLALALILSIFALLEFRVSEAKYSI